jgi:hypothetical protein
MTALPDFRNYCEAACIHVWGEPSSRNARELRWRGCDAYSARTYDIRKRVWFDHGQVRGGSTLDLVAYENGQPKQELRGVAFFNAWAEAHRMGLVPEPPPPQPNGQGGAILASYRYRDESGQLLYEVVRFDTTVEKDRFRQRRPDGEGGWIWKTKGVRQVLYRLPELIAAQRLGQRILITEGERDANTAVALGFAATTMPGGVGKWRNEYDEHLRGADVVVVADNDRPGQEHAAKVARRLSRVATKVRVITPPDVKDLTVWREAGGSRAALKALIEAAPDLITSVEAGGHKPIIKIRLGELGRIVDETEAALMAAQRGLYRRGGLIVSVGVDKMQTFDGKSIETQVIEERGDYALLEDCEAVAGFVRWSVKDNKDKKCAPPFSIIRTLKDRSYRLRFPSLVALTNCPSIKANGELLIRPGFDAATGVLFDPGTAQFPCIPDLPTRAEAEEALKRLKQLIETFDLVDSDSEAVALSLFLTAITRPGMPSAPLHGFSAPVAGAGKSKLVDIASILATGHEAGVVSPGEDREETEKRLAALLLRGAQLIALDNCDLPLEGVLINQALTQPRVELRILGQSRMVTTRCAATLTATGNNLVFKGDLTRRGIIARLDPKVAQPELRTFNYDPIVDAKDNRGEMVAAALTVMRAYIIAGRPDCPTPLGSFEDWSRNVRGPLIWLGVGDPISTMDRIRKADPTLSDLKAVMHAWRGANGEAAVPARLVIETADEMTVGEPGTKPSYTHPILRDALMTVAGRRDGKINPRALGNWLSDRRDRIVDLAETDGSEDAYAFETVGERHGVALWRLAKRQK